MIPLWFGPDDIEDAARQWSRRIAAAREQARELPAYMELRYEDLVAEPASTLESVCEFLELPWSPATLEYHREAEARLGEPAADVPQSGGEPVDAATRMSIHGLAVAPPRTDRVGRWRTEMPGADRTSFERIAGEMLKQLGYLLD